MCERLSRSRQPSVGIANAVCSCIRYHYPSRWCYYSVLVPRFRFTNIPSPNASLSNHRLQPSGVSLFPPHGFSTSPQNSLRYPGLSYTHLIHLFFLFPLSLVVASVLHLLLHFIYVTVLLRLSLLSFCSLFRFRSLSFSSPSDDATYFQL